MERASSLRFDWSPLAAKGCEMMMMVLA